MQLFYKEYPGRGTPLIIMHGLFGMLDNWHNIARSLSGQLPVFLTDLRNHGQSPHSQAMSYPLMADDLWEFMQSRELDRAFVMGHSMGGKVAMEFALRYPEKCSKLVVVDIAPKAYAPGHNQIFKALLGLELGDGTKSRKEMDEELSREIPDFGVRQFLLKSLTRKESGEYGWKFNLDALYRNYDQINGWLAGNRKYEGETLFIGGGNSRYITRDDLPEMEQLFPACRLEMIEGAGHWVHADKPEELVNRLIRFLIENQI